MMNCEDIRPFLDAYVDEEFDERERAEVEAHIDACEECRAVVEYQTKIKETLRQNFEPEEAPDSLRQKIFEGLEAIDEEESRTRQQASGMGAWQYAAAAAPLAIGIAFVMWFFPGMTVAPVSSDHLPVVEQTVDWHTQDFPIEVAGSEPSEVANWFRGKVDFPVRLPKFQDERVSLIGGRIAHIQEQRAAYVVYDVDGARLSVMMFHGGNLKVPTDGIRKVGGRDVALLNNNGYEVAVMQDDGVTYTLTSDLAESELVDIVASTMDRPPASVKKSAN